MSMTTLKTFLQVQEFSWNFLMNVGDTAMLTLETEPSSGDVCYLTLNKGQVRCFRYVVENVAPTPMISVSPKAGIAPVTVQFSSDGTLDRENDPITYFWNFGNALLKLFLNVR
jgi:PKD repeat protein